MPTFFAVTHNFIRKLSLMVIKETSILTSGRLSFFSSVFYHISQWVLTNLSVLCHIFWKVKSFRLYLRRIVFHRGISAFFSLGLGIMSLVVNLYIHFDVEAIITSLSPLTLSTNVIRNLVISWFILLILSRLQCSSTRNLHWI